jgi:endonuclease III
MATPNRAALINRTLKVAKKYYKPVPAQKDRSLFEHLLFAALVENSPFEVAEQVFKTFQDNYFDWNEVRVSTIRELAEVTKPLVDPAEAATRLKQTLHSVFENVYQFDLESLKKQNIGAAVKNLQKYKGSTPFSVSYITQMALGGHAVPVNNGLLLTMHVVGAISDAEAKAGTVPGLERVISKNKSAELSSLMHQLGVEIGRSPYGPNARKLLLEIAPDAKARLPKRKTQAELEPPPPPPPPPPAKTKAGRPAAEPPRKPAAKASAAAPPAGKKAAKPPEKKKMTTSRPTKRPTKHVHKPPAKKKTTTRKLTKRKPR